MKRRREEEKSTEGSGEDKVNSSHGNRKDRVVGRTRSPRPDEEAKC